MLKQKINLNLSLKNNYLHKSFEGNNTSYNSSKFNNLLHKTRLISQNHHQKKNYSFSKYNTKDIIKNYFTASLSPKKKKNTINLTTATNLFHNITNYIPLPNKKKNYPNLNFISPNNTLLKKSSSNSNSNLLKNSNSNKSIVTNIHPNSNSKVYNSIPITSTNSISNSPKILNTDSTNQSTDNQRKLIDKLQREVTYLKDKNESQKKYYESKIKTLNSEKKNISEKYSVLLKHFNKVKAENDTLKNKELKMMKIFFLMKKEGINLDEIISRAMEQEDDTETSENNLEDKSMISLTSVIFPDKVQCVMQSKNLRKVPLLDFRRVPEYESSEEEDDDDNNYAEVNYNNYIANKGKKGLIKSLSLKDIQKNIHFKKHKK